MILEVKKLKVEKDRISVLKGVNLRIKKGEIQALLGPNASGKSSLAQVIAGNQNYNIKEGKVFLNGKDITKLAPEKRVKMGLVLTWQSPPGIKGIKLSQLLPDTTDREPFSYSLLDREVNINLSGGEKKMSELMQILALEPKLVIFDEIDSGLDLKKIKETAEIIKRELIKKGVAVLLITHSGEILNFLNPKITNVMVNGRIICKNKNYKKILKVIKKYGYEKCKKCQLLASK